MNLKGINCPSNDRFKTTGLFTKHQPVGFYAHYYLFGQTWRKVALKITDKGYCSTKPLYYYGLKLQVLAFQHPKQVPFPQYVLLSPASENDLNVFKHNWGEITDCDFYGDKIYHHANYFENLALNNRACMFTPVAMCRKLGLQIKGIMPGSRVTGMIYSFLKYRSGS